MELLVGGRETVVRAIHALVTKIQQEEDWAKLKSSKNTKDKEIHKTAKMTEALAYRVFQGKSSSN